jgi:hypothetical protein
MKPGRALLSAGDSLLDRVLCIAGAFVFSQAPEFAQQYLQRLGGHVDEARRALAQFQQTAAQSGLTLPDFIARTQANTDPAVAKLANVMASAVTRVETLEANQAAIQNASLWTRPLVLLRHGDPDIARATWSIFKPALPATAEGLVYAALGLAVFLILYHGAIRYPIVRIARARRPKNPTGREPSLEPLPRRP